MIKSMTTDGSKSGLDTTRCELIVEGKLVADGTSGGITFQSSNGGTTKDEWYGIVFRSTADNTSKVKYCTLKNARYAIYCDSLSPTLTNNTISASTVGVYGLNMNSSGSIAYNTISSTTTAIALYSGSAVPVTYNTLSSNVRSG